MLTLNFMKNVFDAIDVGVTVTDNLGNIIYVNAAQLNRSHYTYQEYMNLNVRTLYETKVSDTCLFDVAAQHKKAVSAIQRTYHKSDGSSYEKLVTATPLFDADGHVSNVITTYIDLEVFREKYSQALLAQEISINNPKAERGYQSQVVYRSEVMERLLDIAASVAESDSAVLLSGESGTGKEVIATFIHNKSPRCKKSWSRSTVLPCQSPSWKQSCSATKREPLPGPQPLERSGLSQNLMAVRSFWMR